MARIHGESASPVGLLRTMKSWFRRRSDQVEFPELQAEVSPASEARTRNKSSRLLVVDDNPSNLGVVSEMLEQCGIYALLAADGAEAVALCGELDFDLVLMDLQMPILDGLAATSAIRRNEVFHLRPTVPVVAFSSWQSTDGLLDACGFSGILCKPCSLAQLEACLVRWCPGYRPCLFGFDEWDPADNEFGVTSYWGDPAGMAE